MALSLRLSLSLTERLGSDNEEAVAVALTDPNRRSEYHLRVAAHYF